MGRPLHMFNPSDERSLSRPLNLHPTAANAQYIEAKIKAVPICSNYCFMDRTLFQYIIVLISSIVS